MEDEKLDLSISRKEMHKLLLCFFTLEVESCPLNAESFCNVLFNNFKPNLPHLNPENTVRLDVLMELFFKQLMTFSEYVDSSGKVEVYKHADFVLYAMRERLKEEFPGKIGDK